MARATPPVLVTGAAGFIGYHVARRLLERGETVLGLDNLNDYYDVRLKKARLAQLKPFKKFEFRKLDLVNRKGMAALFAKHKFRRVVHLAAQAGVRYSLVNPHAYTDSNVVGFMNVLEGCRHAKVEHLVYASTSSVYGGNTRMPFSVHDNVDHPVSLYAATKKANELMAHTYAHLYGIPCTGLRFFTVYGPWGRPDMALFSFTENILKGKPIELYNGGDMRRDFTYIDDIIDGFMLVFKKQPKGFEIFNLGRGAPAGLKDFVTTLESALGVKANIINKPMQAGDVHETYASVEKAKRMLGFSPKVLISEGIPKFVEWYKSYIAHR